MNHFDVLVFWDDLLRLGLALLLGSLIGIERQLAGQAAGLRTHGMVSIGAAVLTLVGLSSFGDQQVTRVVQGIASGVGFIGAGAILKASSDSRVTGLTTASSVWMAAALGTAAGLGEYALAAAAGSAAILVLFVLRPVSRWISKKIEAKRDR
ncbi:MAG: MgtC/SapB family protein [Planctomycetota bacterium]